MGTSQFPLSNMVTVSVSAPNPGFAGFNTGNLAIFTDEPAGVSFPGAGIQYYQSAAQVATDFGTSSRTYLMANAIFAQNPNILTAGGQLIIVAMKTGQMTLTLNGVPASGSFELVLPAYGNYAGGTTVAINWNDTLSQITAKVQAVPGYAGVSAVSGSLAGESVVFQMAGVYGATPSLPTVTANSLQTGGSVAITVTPSLSTNGESVAGCLARTQNSTAYAAVLVNELYETIGSTDFNAAATAFQATSIFWAVVGTLDAENASPSGAFFLNTQAGNSQTRTMTYLDATNNNALTWYAGYFSELMSVNFNGFNTAITMNGKQVIGAVVDSVIAPGTTFNDAQTAGSDVYISIQGTPVVRSFGANLFADQVTGRLWLKGAIQTAYFNLLVQASTKIPQTETGMNMIRSVLNGVMQQGVRNGYVAPGKWQLSQVFGDVTSFYNNLANYGYYIFVPPVSSQTLAQIQARTAPLAQIAYNEAGAVHTGSVVLYVQA